MSEHPYQQQPTDPAAGADPYGSYGSAPQPPVPAYGEQPQPTYGADPYGSYGSAPQPGYGTAEQGQQQSYPGYGAPEQGYQQPYPGYGAPQPGYPYEDPQAKSRLAAGLLGIFLGAFGIHRFYLGYTGVGVAMLLITVLSFSVLSPLVAIWGFVEGILYLTSKSGQYSVDATGRPLRS